MVTLDRAAEISLDTLKAEDRVLAERAFAIIECFTEGDTMQKIRKVSMPDPSEDFYIVEQGHLSFLFEVHGECKLVVDITATARLRFFQKLRAAETAV